MVDLITVKFIFKNPDGQVRTRLIPMREDSYFEAMVKEMGKRLLKEDKNLNGYYLSESNYNGVVWRFISPIKEYKWLKIVDNPSESEFLCWVPAILNNNVLYSSVGVFPIEEIDPADLKDLEDCPLEDNDYLVRVFKKSIANQNPV